MANTTNHPDWKKGQLERIDDIEHGDKAIASALKEYGDFISTNKSSQKWAQAVQWVENILFGAGRHYVDDILVNRLTTSSSGEEQAVVRQTLDNIPKPVNDLLGRYVETNIALLTENRPMPRVTPKSEDSRDVTAAELSELTLEYLWEALDLPEKHREIVRLMLYCGVAWLEVTYDEAMPRRMTVPQTERVGFTMMSDPNTGEPIKVPIPRNVPKFQNGKPVMSDKIEYGDITATIVSPFEMHTPSVHWWDGNDMGWIMREFYVDIEEYMDKFEILKKKRGNPFKKSNGWFLDDVNKDAISSENITKLPLWWWERLSNLVEGPMPSLYVGTPEQWDGYATVRIIDRKPNDKWPRGRTVITIGDQLIYDSPKSKGARAYDPRWPSRWHPYVRFRWEGMPGSIYGRSLVSKLLPKLKRINSIDSTMIMWRRTIPMSAWVAPKGCGKPNEIVYLADGQIKFLKDISIGDSVQTKTGIEKVVNKFEYENDEQVYKIGIKGNLPIEFTGNHKIPVIPKNKIKSLKRIKNRRNYSELNDGDIIEKTIDSVNIGDCVLSQFTRPRNGKEKLNLSDYWTPKDFDFKSKKLPPNIFMSEEFLRLAGLYLAEGSLGGKNHVGTRSTIKWTFGIHERNTLAEEVKILIEDLFGLKARISEDHYGNGSRVNVICNSVILARLFSSLFGRGSTNKRIPEEIFTYPGSLLPLVGGWLDGDGNSQKIPSNKDGRTRTWKQSRGFTTSINLAYQIRGILFDEGIPCSINKDLNNRKNPKYILGFDSQARADLSSYCNRFKELTHQKTARQGFWLDKWFCVPIKKIEKIDYKGIVYDLEVEGDHHYQVSATIVHNSHPQKDLWSGRPGLIWEYDPRQTVGQAPEPVHPPNYPEAALRERETQIAEMEFIAGTEEVLRGQRPAGISCWTIGSYLIDSNGMPVRVEDLCEGQEMATMSQNGPIFKYHSREFKGNVIHINSHGNLPIEVTPNHEFPVIPAESIPHKKGECVPPSPDSIVRRKASELKKGDLLLSGFNRSREYDPKLDVLSLGGVFHNGPGGESHGAVNITNLQAEEIRIRSNNGETQKSLSKEFHISEASVSRLVNNKTFNGSSKTRGIPIPPYIELNEDVLWLFGVYLAEGNVCFANSDGEPSEVQWAFNINERYLADNVEKILYEQFGLNSYITERRSDNTLFIRVSNRALARLFNNLFGRKANNKYIHSSIFKANCSLLPLIAGWIDGDGNKDANSLRGDTVSFCLASQIRCILLDEKLYVTLNKSNRTFSIIGGKKYNRHPVYHLVVSGSDASQISKHSLRFYNEQFVSKNNRGRKGFWYEGNYASYINIIREIPYSGLVYNVTMDERISNSNSVNSLGLFTYQSAAAIDMLRKQALASRSAILQNWDESLQKEGTAILQEVIKHIRDDPRYLERIRILAREKSSALSIYTFSGENISDNVAVRIDTASQALLSKEAREAKAIEFLQYAGNLMQIPITLRQAVLDELGFKKALNPQGVDVDRVRRLIGWIKQGDFRRVIPMPTDDPFVFYEFLVNETKKDSFWDLNPDQQMLLFALIDKYKQMIEFQIQQQQEMLAAQAQAGAGGEEPEGGGQ